MKKNIILLITLIYGGFLSLSLLNAEDPKAQEPVTLSKLIDTAMVRNPKIKVAETEAQAYSFRIKPAKTLPDPMIDFSLKNMGLSEWMIGKDPMSGIGVSYTQPFPFFGKLKLAGNMAEKAYEGKKYAVDAVKLDIARQIKTAYVELFYLQRSIEIIEKQRDLMSRALSLTETMYSVGSGIQSDIFKAQLEITRMEEMLIPMREMIKMKESAINLLLDYPSNQPIGAVKGLDIETVSVSLSQLQETLQNKSPRIKEAIAMEQERSLMVQLSRKELNPDFRVTAGYEFKGKMTGMFEAMIGLDIPLFKGRKQVNRLREAQSMAENAKWERTSMKNEMMMELNDNYLRAKSSENLIQLYKTRLLPQARLAVESSFAAYPVNKTDFMALVGDISSQFSAELAYYRELSQLWSALAAIESLTATSLLNY